VWLQEAVAGVRLIQGLWEGKSCESPTNTDYYVLVRGTGFFVWIRLEDAGQSTRESSSYVNIAQLSW
jgi:hypothetical protein